MLLDVRVFCLQGLYKRPGDLQNSTLAFVEPFGILSSCSEPGDPIRPATGTLQGAQGRDEYRALVSCLGEYPAHGGQGRVVRSTCFLGDKLLERERHLAGPALACPAQNDDEHLVPVAESALPAFREPPPDPLEEGITRVLSLVTNEGRLHRQDGKRPAV